MTSRNLCLALLTFLIGCGGTHDQKAFYEMTINPHEMTEQQQTAWQSEGKRLGELKSYLPPKTIDTMPCDYTKGDRHEIVIFAVEGELNDVGRWFTSQLPIHIYEDYDYAPGQLTLYSLYDRDSRAISVILADSETEEATGYFGSYVGPKYLKRMIAHRPCVIGAMYLEEVGWYDRNVDTTLNED